MPPDGSLSGDVLMEMAPLIFWPSFLPPHENDRLVPAVIPPSVSDVRPAVLQSMKEHKRDDARIRRLLALMAAAESSIN